MACPTCLLTRRATEARRLALEALDDGATLGDLMAILADDTVGVGPWELLSLGLRDWREVDRGLDSLRRTVPLGCLPWVSVIGGDLLVGHVRVVELGRAEA
jgi:hypothetical protein